MKKQEAIEIIEQSKIKVSRLVETNGGASSIQQKIKLVDYVPLEIVVNTIDKIGLKKVVVPKFVAEWIEGYRHTNTLLKVLNAAENERVIPSAVNDWILDNQRDFVVAWLDGYEIEQEKLYTVEIPNPNIDESHITVLKRMKDSDNAIELCTFVRPDLSESKFQLTESEIKEDFEWAWQFAKEVER
ncbi:DUF1642 domain-containing protein [Streptococcus suis]|uniref:DUF1642 domain-containing protein n=1 Tax=Streptococcus suis TaxID=1307 RepID=UPI00040F01C8|nr:DUF1642 domain-containing protein [Streptococcus suis]MBS0737577.1 DUF1642 domain-containing protein [Streptococcus suis]MBS0739494.1 DUF1642 domain-containing protein [Streptococcus suis]MBS0741412.1 DUF1642 domain-containing protein [Streptococcus suis]MBS0747186.1 DUF1642 domain-containing protein [Streptococcus suis]MBS0780511.1 DUF1642 domain-containing protein [Streptococcus suis]